VENPFGTIADKTKRLRQSQKSLAPSA